MSTFSLPIGLSCLLSYVHLRPPSARAYPQNPCGTKPETKPAKFVKCSGCLLSEKKNNVKKQPSPIGAGRRACRPATPPRSSSALEYRRSDRGSHPLKTHTYPPRTLLPGTVPVHARCAHLHRVALYREAAPPGAYRCGGIGGRKDIFILFVLVWLYPAPRGCSRGSRRVLEDR